MVTDRHCGGTTARDAYSPAEAATRLGISLATIYRAIRRGLLPARRLGGRLLVGRAALDAWLAAGPPLTGDGSGGRER